jgi:prepilin-type N-terminal cleavage/methylation domain-containing protein
MQLFGRTKLSGFTPQNCVAEHVPQSSTAGYALKRKPSGFTLVELLISIGILSVLATAAVIVVDPTELLKQARDATRVSDLQMVNKALALYEADGNTDFGVASTIYVSLPDTQADCSSYTLPPLPGGWSYACKPESTYQAIDGTGWIPVDLTSLSAGSPLAVLPVDPVNSATNGHYYTYAGGSWELTALFESAKKTTASRSDGGIFPGVFEIGPDLTLGPLNRDRGLLAYWRMNEGTGSTTIDEVHNYPLSLSGSWDTGIEGAAYRILGSGWVTTTFTQPIGTAKTYIFWFRLPDTSDTSGTFFCTEDGSNVNLEDNLGQTNYGDRIYSGYGSSQQTSALNTSDTDWHMFALTKEKESLVCKDDTCIKMGDLTGNPVNVKKLIFNGGCAYGMSNFSQGITIDEIRIYDTVLSEEDIMSIYTSR